MATCTAQILVGLAHPNHGGINPSYQLFLSENSRPCWECFPIGPSSPGQVWKNEGHTVWIPPGPGSILECGLLMVALHCFDPMDRRPVNKELVNSAKSMSKKIMDKFVDMSILTDKQFKELYDMAKKIELDDSDKLIVTVLAGSSITERLKELKKHKYDFEVCFSDIITGNNFLK
ncbi:uncharacterized protein METZ01_LOCUS429295 [marine metagenome]|uniref:Uncharacterized protein n=1 Tax=marine metagenome TaxID=408172 RepID=A0A382Y118_9ZZZZ